MLNDRLKRFTKAGISERVVFTKIPPRVEYRPSDFGEKFLR
ncbi:MAG: HxlR-like helix-turn-helix [Verrucomicrobiota bacterium]|jgi:DNA-binding HxlR family transcriptional regulator